MPNVNALNPGALRHPITILHQQPIVDVSGASIAYVALTTTRASIDHLKASDLIRHGQTVAQQYLTLRLRYRPGIDTTMRVQAQNGTYDIVDVENVQERNRVLVLTCLALGTNQ
jgi:SPP1 family predicted phage head-tail adaptor